MSVGACTMRVAFTFKTWSMGDADDWFLLLTEICLWNDYPLAMFFIW